MTVSGAKSSTHKNGETAPFHDELNALGRDAKKLAHAVGDEAKTRVSDVANAAREQSSDIYTAFATSVKSKPVLSLGIAAAAGMFVATLMQGRR